MSVESIEGIIEEPTKEQLKTLEEARGFWKKIAKKHHWYKEPFYVQAWIRKNGE